MKKFTKFIRESTKGVLGAIFVIYFLTTNVMMAYYWWKDVKAHNSFVRAVTIAPMVGVAKGAVWPYFAFVHGKYIFKPKYADIDRKTEMTISGFFAGQEYFSNANKLASNTQDPLGLLNDFENILSLLKKSKERLSQCDIETLNTIYPEWGDMVRDKLLPGVNLSLASLEPMGDRDDLIRANALVADFDTWMQDNWNGIVLSLNAKYGFEYR